MRAASGHTGRVKRARAHPRVQAALIAKDVSEPWARVICEWTGKLPEDSRDAADGILLAAAVSGLGLPDLAGLAGEMYERSRQHQPDGSGPDPVPGQDPDPDPGHEPGREQGENQDSGEVKQPGADWNSGQDRDPSEDAGLDDRSVWLMTTFGGAGAEDTRSHEQRYHDALREAMRPLCFCVMPDTWTTCRQTGRKPSSGRAYMTV